jgi:putative SOS response-associated peptidase YedK
MCGRFSFVEEDALIRERFGIRVTTAIYKARYNCAPSQDLAVITSERPEQLQFFRWGLIPSWAKDPSIGNKMINARAETITEKPSFRSAMKNRRCLIPATGFFEWRRGKDKTPFHIRMKNRGLFAFAGLWERWQTPESETIQSFTIITTTPNRLMQDIHDRMPVILTRESEKLWLSGINEQELVDLLKPYDHTLMEALPVSALVNSPLNDRPEVLEPVTRQPDFPATLF